MALQVSQKEKDSASDDLATQIKSLQRRLKKKRRIFKLLKRN